MLNFRAAQRGLFIVGLAAVGVAVAAAVILAMTLSGTDSGQTGGVASSPGTVGRGPVLGATGTDTPPRGSARPPQSTAARGTRTLYVSTTGSDTGAGTEKAPFFTVARALAEASGGDTILVAPGQYPAVIDSHAWSSDVTVRSSSRGVSVAGLTLAGSQHLRFVGLKFTAPVVITQHAVLGQRQPSRDVAITDSEITTEGLRKPITNDQCLVIRSGSKIVDIERDHIHDCGSGILSGSPTDPVSIRIRISGNEIDHFRGDALKFGRWSKVTIDANNIHDIADPAGRVHNDAIQFLGGASIVRVTNNRIHNSRQQLLFVQDMIRQPNTDVLVANNLLYDSGAIAVQFQGAINARFVNNTQWASTLGGVLVRKGKGTLIPQDTVVADNIMSSLNQQDGVGFAYVGNNVLQHSSRTVRGRCDRVLADPGFVDVTRGDFRLRRTSSARGIGASAFATRFDINGRRRKAPGAPGALAPR